MIKLEDYRDLGDTGFKVSPLSLGTVKFGRNQEVKYPCSFSIPDDDSLRNLLDKAKSLGINFLDTAPAYGDSEMKLGGLLSSDRDDWIICTKVGEYFENGKSRYDFSASSTQTSIEFSLRNLCVEELDLVLVHSDGNDEEIIKNTDVIDTLKNMQAKGHVRAIGMSVKTAKGGLLALQELDVLMVTLSQTDQSQVELINAAKKNDKGILIKKAFDSGHIKDKKQAINYAVNYPGVSSVVIGTINTKHLQENVAALDLEKN